MDDTERSVERRKNRRRLLLMLGLSRSFCLLSKWWSLRKRNNRSFLTNEKFSNFSEMFKAASSSDEIEKYTSVSGTVFNQLLDLLEVRKRNAVPRELRLFLLLIYLKSGSTQNYLANLFGLHQTTMSKIIQETTTEIVKHADDVIKWPTIEEIEENEIMSWSSGDGMRHFGVVDGKHWKVEHPPNSGKLNSCYKGGFFSFNSLVVVDVFGRIIFCQLTKNGVNNDSQLYHGPLSELLEDESVFPPLKYLPGTTVPMGSHILGDGGFPLTKRLINPFRATSCFKNKHIFNRILSKHRVKVENVFGIITTKHRAFRKSLEVDISLARKLVLMTLMVHNISTPRPVLFQQNFGGPLITDPYPSPNAMREKLAEFVLNF